jgi:hypothetical protein
MLIILAAAAEAHRSIPTYVPTEDLKAFGAALADAFDLSRRWSALTYSPLHAAWWVLLLHLHTRNNRHASAAEAARKHSPL